MRLSGLFPSKYLKALDLEGDTVFTIKAVVQEEFDGEAKPGISFEETEKILLLNRTNGNTIGVLHGQETDHWAGKRITLFATEVDFKGKQTLAIRVRMRSPEEQKPEITDDDIAF